ncbi:MAG: lipocalin-like domain-containing protein, partial [Syntrophales bacterium]|nr:lipocalin-like domain-containing protein [Syntrophales bacterium]
MKSRFTCLVICLLAILSLVSTACAAAPAANTKSADAAASAVSGKPSTAAIMFGPKDIDDALHEGNGVIYEWWYLDAAFDNGYSVSMSWQISDPTFVANRPDAARLVQFSVYDPSGKKTSVDATFDPKDVTASKTMCDVTMGSNHLKGNIKHYDVEFTNKDMGCKLAFDSAAEGFRGPPDGITYFTKQPARWIGWTIAQPRSIVTGTLTLNGKEMPVKGIGYHDHNWGNIALSEMYNYWYWGRIFLPNYSFIYSVGEMTDALGKKPSSVILSWKGDKLVDVTVDITAEPSDFVLDKFTNAKYPQTLILRPNGAECKGIITHKLNHLVEALLPWGAS